MKNPETKLEPCPFCGNEEVTLWPMPAGDSAPAKWYSPVCEACGATICENIAGHTTVGQVATWNRRAPIPAGVSEEDERGVGNSVDDWCQKHGFDACPYCKREQEQALNEAKAEALSEAYDRIVGHEGVYAGACRLCKIREGILDQAHRLRSTPPAQPAPCGGEPDYRAAIYCAAKAIKDAMSGSKEVRDRLGQTWKMLDEVYRLSPARASDKTGEK